MDDFRIKTTKSFTHTITVDGSAPTFTDADYVYFIMKDHIDDTDAEAIITKTGTNGDDGEVTFVLSATDTDVDPRTYYYEFKWENGTSVYITESDTVNVLKRVFD